MSINYWRYVEYTDDGCSLYQCLSCYETWESRTSPGYFGVDDDYLAHWKFCPYCGTQWAGMWTTSFSRHHEGHRQLGRRRHRIAEAIERLRDKWRRDEGPYPDTPPEPPYWLVIERSEQADRNRGRPLDWSPAYKMSGFHPSAKRMLDLAHEDVAREEADDLNADVRDGFWKRRFFARVIVVRDLKKRYPGNGYISEIRPQPHAEVPK